MIIVIAHCGNGYCGCDSDEVFFFDDGTSEKMIDEDVCTWAMENGETYSYVHFGWDYPYTEEEYDDYLENCVDYNWHDATYEEYLEWCDDQGVDPVV